jgi:hypothetical protein
MIPPAVVTEGGRWTRSQYRGFEQSNWIAVADFVDRARRMADSSLSYGLPLAVSWSLVAALSSAVCWTYLIVGTEAEAIVFIKNSIH